MIPKPQKRSKSQKKHTAISPETYAIVHQRDGGKCVVCGSAAGIEQHHIETRSKGGAGSEENLVVLCKTCHYVKLHGMGDYYTKMRIYEYMIRLGYVNYRADLTRLQYREEKLNEQRFKS